MRRAQIGRGHDLIAQFLPPSLVKSHIRRHHLVGPVRPGTLQRRHVGLRHQQLLRRAKHPVAASVVAMVVGVEYQIDQAAVALNGGNGPEIYAAAMNGDITLRKID